MPNLDKSLHREKGITCGTYFIQPTMKPRQNYKRHDKDDIHPSVSAKRPRVTPDSAFLFGDTDDLEYDDDLLELDYVPIPRITAPKARRSAERELPVNVRYRQVLKHVPTVPYVPVTASSGERFYLRLLPDTNSVSLKDQELDPRQVKIKPKPYKGILGVNFHKLKREAELLRKDFYKLTEKFNTCETIKTEKVENEMNFEMEIEELDPDLFGIQSIQMGTKSLKKESMSETHTTLWVDKYKPTGYMDLLSEETVNRDLLHWLKLWDNCVFGKDYLAKYKEMKEKFAKLEEKDPWKKVLIQDDSYDELGRPQQKIVLLHGPAGLGKTTAAHIIARQAGYNVIEINASDDRSVDVFKKILDSTTESRSEMFQDGRPNCLVVDEIDGSPTATVDVLVNLVSGKAKESGKTKRKKVLRRPIICICNELYIPALKNLRQVALVLQFHPISVSSLVQRVEEISFKEDMTIDNTTLHNIAEMSECDIRSCLSTIQFIKQKNGKVTHSMLNQLGTKDKSKGIFSVWEDIFFLPEAKRYYSAGQDPTKADARFRNVLSTVQNFGDYEKLQGGIFENYLKARYRDSYFEKVLKCLEWTNWFSDIQGKMNMLQNYSLFPFLPMYFVSIHFQCAGRTRFRLQYPTNTLNLKCTRLTDTFKAQLIEIPAPIGKFLSLTNAILDVYPSMLSIIQPSTIRPIPNQLWSPTEKECFQNILDIMIGYHLSYTQQRSPEGKYFYQLDPCIEELVRFNGEDVSTHKQFPYTLKQIISREIEVIKMREDESDEKGQHGSVTDLESNNKETSIEPKSTPKLPTSITEPVTPLPPTPLPNWKQPSYTKAQPVKPIEPVVAKDFFGRPIKPKPVTPEQAKLNMTKAQSSGIWYQYKEGYSNSVRKKLKVSDFL